MRFWLVGISLYTWALPVTIAGWLLRAAAKRSGVAGWMGGVYVVEVERLPWPIPRRMWGFTAGGVMMVEAPLLSHADYTVWLVLGHEYQHSVHAAVFGLAFPVLYALDAIWARVRHGERWHEEMVFERDAERASLGGVNEPHRVADALGLFSQENSVDG